MLTRKALAVILMAFVLLPSTKAAPNRRNQIRYRPPGVVKSAVSDTTPPRVAITLPTVSPTFSTRLSRVTIGGEASDDTGISSVTWTNSRGGGGTCVGTTSWSAAGIPLADGVNAITVTTVDMAGNSATDSVTVTKDVEPPTVIITSPAAVNGAVEVTASKISITGVASDNTGIVNVAWTNLNTASSGQCEGTNNWAANEVDLCVGENEITVTATDSIGLIGTAVLLVTFTDHTTPQIEITYPTSEGTWTSQYASLDLRGTVVDNSDMISIQWTSDRGDSGSDWSWNGTWSCWGVPLKPGRNVITVTAEDASGNSSSDVIEVAFTDVSPPEIMFWDIYEGKATFNCQKADVTLSVWDDVGVTLTCWWTDKGYSGVCWGYETVVAEDIELEPGANLVTFVAYDSSGNASSLDLTADYIPSSPGETWTGLSLVSVPIIPWDPDPKVNVGFMEDYWLSYERDTCAYARYPDSETWLWSDCPTRGFWAYFNAPDTAYPRGRAVDHGDPYYVSLYKGWNLIGQPFLLPINWDLDAIQVNDWYVLVPLRDAGNSVELYAWGWDSAAGNYYLVGDPSQIEGAVPQLAPWQGYWIRAKTDCMLILPPPLPMSEPAGASASGR